MNDDHADSVQAYARAYGGEPQAQGAVITALNADGFVLAVTLPGGATKKGVLVPYTTSIASAKDLHKVAVAMHHSAFNKLGFGYKVRSGYYLTVAQMVWVHGSKAAGKRPCVSLGVLAGVGVVAVAFSRARNR